MRKLTYREARLLTRARWLLADLTKAAEDGVRLGAEVGDVEPGRVAWGQAAWDGYQLGLIAGRCDRADDAIFDALNSLAHYGEDPRALAALHATREGAAA